MRKETMTHYILFGPLALLQAEYNEVRGVIPQDTKEN